MDSPASGRGWRLADAATVPALWNVGHDGVPTDDDEAYERIAERDPGIVERWEAIERRHPGYDEQVEYHSVRQHFGIRAFGVALETPTTMLVIGGVPGKAYAPPPFALDWADASPPDAERSQ